MSATFIRVRDYRGPVVAATCAKCGNDNLKPFGGPALNFCSHCGIQFPRMFDNPLQQPKNDADDDYAVTPHPQAYYERHE